MSEIPDMEGLYVAVALERLACPIRLDGREIRLLRKTTGIKAVDFAKKVGAAPGTFSRWENGKEVMSAQTERFVRAHMAITLHSKSRVVVPDIAAILEMDLVPIRPDEWPAMHFERIKVVQGKEKQRQWDTFDEAA